MLEYKHNFAVYSGDSHLLTITVEDESSVVDLTNYSINWRIDPPGNPMFYRDYPPLLTKSTTDGGVKIIDVTRGKFTVHLTSEDTKSLLRGQYPHFGSIVSPEGEVTTVTYGVIQII